MFSPQITSLNNNSVMLLRVAKKKSDIYKIGDSGQKCDLYKINQFYSLDSTTVAHQNENLVFIGCMQKTIDVLTAENFVKFKRFQTNNHPSCFFQLTPEFLLVGQYQGDLAYIDIKNMRIQELGQIANNIGKIEHICKLQSRNYLAIAT